MSDSLWVYRPHHRLEYLDHPRLVFLGEAEQEILKPFLDREPTAYLFSPAESSRWWQENRHRFRLRKRARSSPATKQRRKSADPHGCRPCFNRHGFAQAIEPAIRKARKFGHVAPHFTPYDLRHTRLTEVERTHGLRAAQAIAGHMGLKTTQIYLHELEAVARQVTAASAGLRVYRPAWFSGPSRHAGRAAVPGR